MPSVRLIDRYLDQRGVTDDGLPVRMTLQSSLPLTAPALVARVGDEAVQLTGRVGEYWVDFPLRRSLWTVGMQTATLEVVPSEPWHRPVTREVRVLVVNLLLVGLALVVLAAIVVLMAYVRRVQVASLPRAPAVAPAPVTPLPRPLPLQGLGPSSPRHAVVTLYLSAVQRVEALTGLAFGRTVTLREFLSSVTALLGRAGDFFARLTLLAEEALYSKREFDAADVAHSHRISDQFEGDAARESPGTEAGRP